jgi:hypothetical protein
MDESGDFELERRRRRRRRSFGSRELWHAGAGDPGDGASLLMVCPGIVSHSNRSNISTTAFHETPQTLSLSLSLSLSTFSNKCNLYMGI